MKTAKVLSSDDKNDCVWPSCGYMPDNKDWCCKHDLRKEQENISSEGEILAEQLELDL